MKNLMVVHVHSFVDLITNSSSELFVCEGEKTVKAVEDLIVELAKLNNKVSDEKIPTTKKEIFNSILKKPEISQYDFSYFKLDKKFRDEYEKYNDPPYGLYEDWLSEIKPPDYRQSPRYKKLQEKSKGLKDAESNKVWKRWTSDAVNSKLNLFLEFLKINGFSDEKIQKAKKDIKVSFSHGPYIFLSYDESSEFCKVFRDFNLYLTYNVSCKKNDIIIWSHDDNSVPYKFMQSLCVYLNANRWHIG